MARPHRIVFAVLLIVMLPAIADAQAPYRNVISINPFGILLEFFNGEYERVVGESSTIGFGGSTISSDPDPELDVDDERYLNFDVFYRFYPSAKPLDGWAFGVKAGITNVSDAGTYPGIGFDVNRSWLVGKRNNFYVGVGFGLKRLLGAGDDDLALDVIPTFRIINVGIAF